MRRTLFAFISWDLSFVGTVTIMVPEDSARDKSATGVDMVGGNWKSKIRER